LQEECELMKTEQKQREEDLILTKQRLETIEEEFGNNQKLMEDLSSSKDHLVEKLTQSEVLFEKEKKRI